MIGPGCAVVCNLITTHTDTHLVVKATAAAELTPGHPPRHLHRPVVRVHLGTLLAALQALPRNQHPGKQGSSAFSEKISTKVNSPTRFATSQALRKVVLFSK